jgi:hypothetical protein
MRDVESTGLPDAQPVAPEIQECGARSKNLPHDVRAELSAFARKLAREHRALFLSDPIYRKRAGQFLTALLPPKPRRRGRPGRPDVTQAIRLLKLYRRQYPNARPAEHWARTYPAVIPGDEDMNPVELRDARERLRERVRWRLQFQREKQRQRRSVQPFG